MNQAATENKILDRTTKTPNWEGRGTYLLLCLKKGDGGSFLAACGASVLKTPGTVECEYWPLSNVIGLVAGWFARRCALDC